MSNLSGCPSRPVVMGIVNVTSDSFSDGGQFVEFDRAVDLGLRLSTDGADVVDVGGESTRPGAQRIDPELERQRVEPVVKELVRNGLIVSIDTMHSSTALAALTAGAAIVNDVSGGTADSRLSSLAAAFGAELVLGHWRTSAQGPSTERRRQHTYSWGVRDDLMRSVDAAVTAGVAPAKIVLDPGLGFGKDFDDNWALLGALPELIDCGFRVMIGASRKRFLGTLLADANGDRDVLDREAATATISALAAVHGAWGVRVHDVRNTRDAIAVAMKWLSSCASTPRVNETYAGAPCQRGTDCAAT
ncbi:MAG: dihydropteroate synthase [Rhodococcus sp. (in: high G+C Gram-positive bacteria)]